jgi:hypothetical protein
VKGRSAFKKYLTEPTLLEMSGYPTNRELALPDEVNCRKVHERTLDEVYGWQQSPDHGHQTEEL